MTRSQRPPPEPKTLNVVKIEPKNMKGHPLVKYPLPRHEFSMLLVAPKGSGKTNLICNLILNHYRKYFHRILVVSPTIENDAKWDIVKSTSGILLENKRLKAVMGDGYDPESLKKLPKLVYKQYEAHKIYEEDETLKKPKFDGRIPLEDFMEKMSEFLDVIAEQNELINWLKKEGHSEAKFIADRILVILDDQAGMFKGGNTNNPVVNYFIRHRHPNTSVIVATQANKAVPKTIRTNCNCLVAFEIPNQQELVTLYDEWPANLSMERWMALYEEAVGDPHSFLYINTHFPKGKRMFKNFTHWLTEKSADKAVVEDHTEEVSEKSNPI